METVTTSIDTKGRKQPTKKKKRRTEEVVFMQIDTIVDALGGTRKVATACGIQMSGVSMWKKRGSIPVEYWAILVQRAKQRQIEPITYELLGKIHAKQHSVLISETAQA